MDQPFGARRAEVLVVEDTAAHVKLIRWALDAGSIPKNIHVARTGVQALAFLRHEPGYEHAPRPDLILLDLNLPGIDGREVLTDIKTDPNLKPIPVVVLTTSSVQQEVVHSYELYANCYVKKPAALQRFMEVLRAIETFWLSVVELPPNDAHFTTGAESLAAGTGQ